MTFTVKILTIFPELFPGSLGISVPGNALREGKWLLEVINIRDYTKDKHQTFDDTPYGGGNGMVMKPDILAGAIEDNFGDVEQIFYMSPRGKLFKQEMARDFSKLNKIGIICGRFEGIDQRVIDHYNITEISIGDYVLFGGEIAAQVFCEALLRNVKGIIAESQAIDEESFGAGEYSNLVEYPQYTKPQEWRGYKVPEILLSGNHQKIADWRLEQAKKITKMQRPDLKNVEN